MRSFSSTASSVLGATLNRVGRCDVFEFFQGRASSKSSGCCIADVFKHVNNNFYHIAYPRAVKLRRQKNPASGYLQQALRTTSSGDEEQFIFDFKRGDGQNVKIRNWNECGGD